MFTEAAIMATSLKSKLAQGMEACKAGGFDWGARRTPETVVGKVMSSAEVNAEIAKGDENLLINCGVAVISDQTAFFLTDDQCFGYGVLPSKFMACTIQVPSRAAARECIPDGVIKTAEQLVGVYCSKEKQLNSMEELLAYLNEHYSLETC